MIKYSFKILSVLFLIFLMCSCNGNKKNKAAKHKNIKKDSLWFDVPRFVSEEGKSNIVFHYTLEWDGNKSSKQGKQDIYLYWTFKDISKSELMQIVKDQDIAKSKILNIRRKTVTGKDSVVISHNYDTTGIYHLSGLLEAYLLLNKGKDSMLIHRQAYFRKDIEVRLEKFDTLVYPKDTAKIQKLNIRRISKNKHKYSLWEK